MPSLTCRPLLRLCGRILAVVALALLAQQVQAQTASKEPVFIGVTGPLTGQYAQYGAQWKKGFDYALDEINAGGGINGRPLQYVFEDSQADPRQTVVIARKFVGDERIVVEVGDFSSAASMAASPIYQAAGLVQFGFTNSHPDFTKGGDCIWSNAVNQTDEMPLLADLARDMGLKRLAVLYINSDWGRTAKDLFVAGRQEECRPRSSARKAISPTRRISAPRSCASAMPIPDGIALISYYPDGAQITRQIHNAGLTQPIIAGGSIYSPKFLELGGDAVNGVITNVPFFPGDPRPVVQKFVQGLRGEVRRPAGRLQRSRLRHLHPARRRHAPVRGRAQQDQGRPGQDQGRAERRLRLRRLRSRDAPRRQPVREPDHGQGRQMGGLGRKDLREAIAWTAVAPRRRPSPRREGRAGKIPQGKMIG